MKFINYFKGHNLTLGRHKDSFFAKIILWGAILYLLDLVFSHLSNPIIDEFGFRQAQTAITSYYFVQEGYKFAYETPVVGYPWSIPFEFPIYQSLVALSVSIFAIPLTEAGRLWSLIFFLLTVFYVVKILEVLNFSKRISYVAAALLTTTPLYLFYSSAFMIESAALFFSIVYLYFLILLGLSINNWSVKNILTLGVFLTLGLLQKLTTIFPLVLITPFILIVMLGWREIFTLFKKPIFYFALIVGMIFPILICAWWVNFTDLIKLQNIIGSELTSTSLRSWNFGTLKQRVSFVLWWEVIYLRNILSSPLGLIGLLILIPGFIFSKTKSRAIILISLSIFLAPFLIFTNLHIVHNYYQYANLLFYIIAVITAIQSLIEYVPLRLRTATFNIVAILLIGSNLINFKLHYYQIKTRQINSSNSELLRLADYLKANTPKDRPIIIYGLDWSSELPFYSERRALALPWGKWDLEALHHTKKFLGDFSPSALVVCGEYSINNIIGEIYKAFNISSKVEIDSCNIFFIR